MKIAFITDAIIPSRAAESVFIMKMCEGFVKNGHQVILIAPDKKSEFAQSPEDFYGIDHSFKIIKTPRPEIKKLSPFLTLMNNYYSVKKAANFQPDLVYGRSLFACYFAAKNGFPVIYESHIPVENLKMGLVQSHILKILIEKDEFCKLVTISNELRKHYIEKYDIKPERVVVEHDASEPVDTNIDPIELDDHTGEINAGYIGNLYPGRGMEIIGNLAIRCPEIQFHIIGGDEEDIKYWQQELSDINNITFHGFLPPQDLDRYRLAFDVLLAPYQSDLETRGGINTVKWMSPLKIFEYMATGRGIITSDLPVLHEVLTHNCSALLCDPNNIEEWVKALEKMKDEEFRRKLGKKAKHDFLLNHTWKQRTRNIISDKIVKRITSQES